ncbi:unnamed protein product [Rotaria sp. Silwood2]|nr:unnamed protein product [Rotaria sp. Silwood2]CAF2671150.1 unnamed protein product [Rotaria sp. Silwood2]CAF2931613.1 unnamed protein product [Rotaria sp. Silwood2]CAF3109600.1 unnamed protein product [Rotaria sp. Silwood2]CAF4159149.1 unnamed protein product [Rotaria sp. Silwood2]
MRSSQPVPLFVIDTCSLDSNLKSIKTPKQSTSNISRSWSLPNCNETYKDLCGAIHNTFSNRFNNFLKQSRSYPNNYLLTYLKLQEKKNHIQSPSTSMYGNINLLDPNGGTQTPSCVSSRYSLHGSFVDLSESGYYPPSDKPFIKSNNKLLTIDGHPLLIVDPFTRLSTNTYQDKCTDWLRRLNINST